MTSPQSLLLGLRVLPEFVICGFFRVSQPIGIGATGAKHSFPGFRAGFINHGLFKGLNWLPLRFHTEIIPPDFMLHLEILQQKLEIVAAPNGTVWFQPIKLGAGLLRIGLKTRKPWVKFLGIFSPFGIKRGTGLQGVPNLLNIGPVKKFSLINIVVVLPLTQKNLLRTGSRGNRQQQEGCQHGC